MSRQVMQRHRLASRNEVKRSGSSHYITERFG